MSNVTVALVIFSVIFILLLISVLVGRFYGKWRLENDPSHKLEVVVVAEGAVFALLGLLIAFTFTGAYERFEARKMYIIEEANDIDTAYLRLDLLEPNSRAKLQKLFGQYVDSRIAVYNKMSYGQGAFQKEVQISSQLQGTIWHTALDGLKVTNSVPATQLLVPAINNMFEIANKRFAVMKVHPPFAIFGLLMLLAMLSAFLAGYSTSRKKIHNSIHMLSYVLITAITLYIIIDLEYPRTGLIRVESFDQVLAHVKYKFDDK